MNKKPKYPLDNAAIIHMAALRKNYSNSFRIAFTLDESICPDTLQQALNEIIPRFPTIIAGIRQDFFDYYVVPAKEHPQVRPEGACLAPMTRAELHTCACRFLYNENRIIGEFFHSLTDGHGGLVVTSTLVAEYLRRKYDVPVPASGIVLDAHDLPVPAETADDYFTYAGDRGNGFHTHRVYMLPGRVLPENAVGIDNLRLDANAVKASAHRYGVSVTTFLCGVMGGAILENQEQHRKGKAKKPIQIMIPCNLRRMFPSRSLRNFTLYALPRIEPEDRKRPFSELVKKIDAQMKQQLTKDRLASSMASNTRAAQFPLIKLLPLVVKIWILRIVHILFGENSSCISLSNLGTVELPEEMRNHVTAVDFVLSPRIKSPYNCGVVTYNGTMSICISRLLDGAELMEAFHSQLVHNR